MWSARFIIKHPGCIIAPKCKKYNVTLYSYFLKSWRDKKKFYYSELYFASGEPKNIKKFYRDLKKESRIKKLQVERNMAFVLTEQNYHQQENAPFFDSSIIQPKPIILHPNGTEEWELIHWDKKFLMKILDIPKKILETKLEHIKKIDIKEIFLPKVFPKIPKKQKQAIELAIKKGYYNYPKKINLESLAKIQKVSRQTYRENLRRAEKKLIPFLLGESQ